MNETPRDQKLHVVLTEVEDMDDDSRRAIGTITVSSRAVGATADEQATNLVQTFKHFDRDGSACLGMSELYMALMHLTREQPDMRKVANIMASFDVSGDGQLSLEEFMTIFYPAPNPEPAEPIAENSDDPMFTDLEFPPTNDSLGEIDVSVTAWKRAPELTPWCGKDELFANIEPNDILQGQLGNCWFLAGISCIAEFPGAIENMFLTRKLADNGMYRIQFFNGSHWQEIVIDDYIPCSNCNPAFSQPNGNELWVMLLEKALAKWCGTYGTTEGGYSCFAWQLCTGARKQTLYQNLHGAAGRWSGFDCFFPDLTEPRNIRLQSNGQKCSSDRMFQTICQNDQLNYVQGASTEKAGVESGAIGHSGGESIRTDGIVKGHAYCVLEVREIDEWKLVKLRNPWGGDAEWNGPWSDSSSEWDAYPEVAKALEFEQKDDGIFWMTWQDFEECYDSIWVSHKSMPCPKRDLIQTRSIELDGEILPMVRGQTEKYQRRDPTASGHKAYGPGEQFCGCSDRCSIM